MFRSREGEENHRNMSYRECLGVLELWPLSCAYILHDVSSILDAEHTWEWAETETDCCVFSFADIWVSGKVPGNRPCFLPDSFCLWDLRILRNPLKSLKLSVHLCEIRGKVRRGGLRTHWLWSIWPWTSVLLNWEEMCFCCLCPPPQVSVMSKAAAVVRSFSNWALRRLIK